MRLSSIDFAEPVRDPREGVFKRAFQSAPSKPGDVGVTIEVRGDLVTLTSNTGAVVVTNHKFCGVPDLVYQTRVEPVVSPEPVVQAAQQPTAVQQPEPVTTVQGKGKKTKS